MEVFEDKKALEIIVTGHSLGGALAVLCALDFRLDPFLNDEKTMERSKSIKVITFGAPKVGDDEFRLVSKVNYVKKKKSKWRCRVSIPVLLAC